LGGVIKYLSCGLIDFQVSHKMHIFHKQPKTTIYYKRDIDVFIDFGVT
jgi:hypothetical protein